MPSHNLTTQLRHIARLLRLRQVAFGLLCWALFAAAAGLVLVALAHWPVRANPLPVMLALTGLALLAALVWAQWRDLRQRRVARVVEAHYPALRESLFTAVELLESLPSEGPAISRPAVGSPALVQAVVAEAAESLARIPRRSLLDLHRLRPLCIIAGVAVLLAGSLTFLSRDAIAALGRPEPKPPPVALPVAPMPAKAPPPLIAGLRITLQPPEYTQLPTRTVTTNLKRLSALPGTRVTISALTPATGQLSLQLNRHDAPLQAQTGNRLAHGFTLARDTAWQLQAHGDGPGPVAGGMLNVIWDNPPTIVIHYPARDLTLKQLKPIKLSATASDDFGLSQIAFEYRLPNERQWRQVVLPASGVVQHVEYEWDLSPLKLEPGQSVSYRFEVWDNNPVRGPRSTVSKTYQVTLAAKPPTEAVQELQQAAEEQRQSLERLREQAEDLQKRLEAMQEQLQGANAEQLSPQQTGELQQAAQQMQKQAEELRQELAQSEQAVQKSGDALPELSRRLSEVNKLLHETLDTKLQEALKQLQQAATKQPPQQAAQSLEQAKQAQTELMHQLDQLLALLKQAQLEGLLGELRQQIDQLAKEQQALIERREKSQDPLDLRAQGHDQKDLSREAGQVEQHMKDAAAQATQQDEKAGQQLQALAQQMQQSGVPSLMQQAAQQLQQAQASQAAGPQQQALDALQKMSGALSGMQAGVYQQMRQELSQAGEELARKALALSERQEQLLNEATPLAENVPEQLIQAKPRLEKLAQRQQAITEGSERLTERLQDLAGKSPLVDPGLVQQAGQIAALAQQAERDLAGGSMAEATAGQEQAMAALNRLAAQLIQSQQGFQQASAQMALQELMRRLQQMAQQQQALNQMTQQGGGPPMGAGGQQQGASGQQLAGQQGDIRQMLQQLLGQAGNQAGVGDQLGGLPQEMHDVEDQMRREQVTQRTFRQQQDILHKMLDAQRSLYTKEKESRERLAEAPKPYKPPSSPPALRPVPVPPMALRSPGTRRDLPLGYEDLAKRYLEVLGKLR